MGYSPWNRKEVEATDHTHTHTQMLYVENHECTSTLLNPVQNLNFFTKSQSFVVEVESGFLLS